MAKTRYSNQKIGPAKMAVIDQANAICEDYKEQGFVLTLRQLYYQFVARGLLEENTQQQYKRIGDICNDARMCGLMDWNFLIDRTRNIQTRNIWDSPEHLIKDMADRYHKDLWKAQKRRIEVWVEKEAAIGVIEGVCRANSVPYFATKGYGSVSEYHAAAQRIRWYIEAGEQVQILHIGDHDPSGVDMTRDIEDRLRTFIQVDWIGLHMFPGSYSRGEIRGSMRRHMNAEREKDGFEGQVTSEDLPWSVKRIALNYDQVEQYNPPPNFAKESDSRHRRYVEQTGLTDSWELDALDPSVLAGLIQDEVDYFRDDDLWLPVEGEMEREREALVAASNWWSEVEGFVASKGKKEAKR